MLPPGPGGAGADDAGAEEGAGGDEDVAPAAPEGGADGGPDGGADGGLDVAGELGGAGGAGASCRQAAMITRLLAGSALPPTPLRSTK